MLRRAEPVLRFRKTRSSALNWPCCMVSEVLDCCTSAETHASGTAAAAWRRPFLHQKQRPAGTLTLLQ